MSRVPLCACYRWQRSGYQENDFNEIKHTMKTYFILSYLIFFSLIGKSQEYSFPLYFEDSVGNKDTLFFGFDQSASFGIDEKFGELNILGQPYDSTFFAFFTDAATAEEWDCYLEKEKTPTYITKKQYVNLWNNPFIEIGLNANNWPVKISWDQKSIKDFDIDQYVGGGGYGLLLTSWRPLDGYPDLHCCGSWPTPIGITWLSDTTDIQIGKNNACLYKANFSNDSFSLIYVSRMYKYTSIKDFQINKFQCWYNEKLESVSIQNINGAMPFKLEIYNTLGIKVMDKQVSGNNGTLINFNISYLPYGLYIVRLYELKNVSLTSTFKIIKR